MSNPLRFNIILLCFVFICAISVYGLMSWPTSAKEVNQTIASPYCAHLSPKLSLEAKSAYAIDVKSNTVLYEKASHLQLPLASLTKVMTILTVSEILSPNDVVTITDEALTPEGDVGLKEGERWSAQDLIDFTLIISANDGAHALALASEKKLGSNDALFVKRMNERADALGMNETFFVDDTGLDISKNTAGAYGSAYDVALLFKHIAKTNPRIIEASTSGNRTFTSLDGRVHEAKNTSMVITNLPGAIGSKTGFTDLAGGNLAVVFEALPGRPVVAVVLGSSRDGRDSDMETLAQAVTATLRRAIICTSGI